MERPKDSIPDFTPKVKFNIPNDGLTDELRYVLAVCDCNPPYMEFADAFNGKYDLLDLQIFHKRLKMSAYITHKTNEVQNGNS